MIAVHGGLDHQVFAIERAEGRQPHDAHQAHGHAGHGPRHLAAQAAQIGEVAAARAHDQRARAQKEQVFHDGVIKHVPERPGRGQPCAQAQHQRDFADLSQSGVGQHALDVFLAQGHELAVDQGCHAHAGEPRAEPGQAEQSAHLAGGLSHAHDDHADNAEHAHLGDDAGQGRGHRGRRGGVGVGQPGVQGNQTGLDAKARQAERQSRLEPERKVEGGQRRGGKDAQNEQAGQHEQRAARAHHIVFEASLIGRAASFVNHQEV